MTRLSLYDGSGCNFTAASDAIVENYPDDTQGTATDVAADSELYLAKLTRLLGHRITVAQVGGTVEYVDSTGTRIDGLVFPAAAVGTTDLSPFGGILHRTATFGDANVGMICSAGVEATWSWQKATMQNLYDGSGADWVLGVGAADRYPTNGIGGATATAASSLFVTYPTKAVMILGVNVTSTNAGGGQVILHDGSSAALVSGTFFPTTALGWQTFPGGPKIVRLAGNCNIGVRMNGAGVAALFYKKIA